jgi:hypothetical protein
MNAWRAASGRRHNGDALSTQGIAIMDTKIVEFGRATEETKGSLFTTTDNPAGGSMTLFN